MNKTDCDNETEYEWIVEEANYCLSYGAHPIVRCLAEDNAISPIFSEESE